MFLVRPAHRFGAEVFADAGTIPKEIDIKEENSVG